MPDTTPEINDKDLTIKVAQFLGWKVYFHKLRNNWLIDSPTEPTILMGPIAKPEVLWDMLWRSKLPRYAIDLNAAWELVNKCEMPVTLVAKAAIRRMNAKETARHISLAYVAFMEKYHPLPGPMAQASL